MAKQNSGVAIVGAGLAGLGAAEALKGARVFEAEAQPGGHARSASLAGVFFDQGAHICHTEKASFLERICAAAGEVNHLAASRVLNYWRGQWLTYPVQNHLHELDMEKRIRALSDLVMAHTERDLAAAENYDAWCRAQYGDFLTDHFYRVFTEKYWRVAMPELATDWLAGRLLPAMLPKIIRGAFEAVPEVQTHFSRFHYPKKGGFFAFFAPLYAPLNVTYNARVVAVDSERQAVGFADGRREAYDWLLSSLPLPRLVGMIAGAPQSVKDAAAKLRHTRLVCVDLVIDAPPPDPHWFYIYDWDLVPARVSVPSNLSGDARDGRYALQAEIFRAPHEPLDVDELVAQTIAALARLEGFPMGDVVAARGRLVEYGYVVSDAERAPAVAHIETWLEKHRITPMGLFGRWKYIWSDQAFFSGWDRAKAIEAKL